MPFDDAFSGIEITDEGTAQPTPAVPEAQKIVPGMSPDVPTSGFFGSEDDLDPTALTPPPEEGTPSQSLEPSGGTGDEGKPRPPQTVPLHVLLEERTRRQAAEQAAAEQREILARADERLRMLHEAEETARLRAEEASREPVPDKDEDPIGYELYVHNQKMRALEEELNSLKGYAGYAEQTFAEQRVEQQTTAVNSWATQAVQEFKSVRPDYDHAYKYLLRKMAEDMIADGLTPQEIDVELRREQGKVVSRCVQWDNAGNPIRMVRNPAEVAYQRAVNRGFVPGQTQVGPDGVPIGQGAVDARARLGNVQRATRQSPGGRGGSATDSQQLTMAKLASMSEAETNELLSTARGRRIWDAVMGAR